MGTSKIKTGIQSFAVNQLLKYIEGNPEDNIPKIMDLIDKATPKGWYENQRKMIRKIIDEKGNWYKLMMRFYDLDEGVRKAFFKNFLINGTLKGRATQNAMSEKYDCNVPWAMLLDPTSACNLKCKGCWAAEYGNKLNLSLEDLDSIVTQGKELGTHVYLFTGGEPMVRKADLIKLCEMHPDCEFMAFTNGTLIDEDFCKEMLRVKNFMPAMSMEGSEETNDARRGEGTYKKMKHAMELLKAHKLPFGVSSCYTSLNCEAVSSEEYFDMLIESGAFFVWFFHYMPIGADASVELLPSPEQREKLAENIKAFRQTKDLFTIDFQNDGKAVNGCIAGGRNYLHINANGDVEPCAFIHYSNVNIHEHTLLEALQSPLFMAYRRNQPFNENMLQPCPMLENPEKLRQMVKESGAHSTDYQSPEDVDDLCNKTTPYAENWKPKADELWAKMQEQ